MLFSEKPLQQEPTTRQTPSGRWPQRAWHTMGEKFTHAVDQQAPAHARRISICMHNDSS